MPEEIFADNLRQDSMRAIGCACEKRAALLSPFGDDGDPPGLGGEERWPEKESDDCRIVDRGRLGVAAGIGQEFANELERHNAAEDGSGSETPYIKESLNDLLELQLLRYRLQLLRRLAESGELPAESGLNDWLQTARFLP